MAGGAPRIKIHSSTVLSNRRYFCLLQQTSALRYLRSKLQEILKYLLLRLVRWVVVVLILVPVDSRPCGTAAIFGEKTATIYLKLTSSVGKSSASNISAARRSLSLFKGCIKVVEFIKIYLEREEFGQPKLKISSKNNLFALYFLQSD